MNWRDYQRVQRVVELGDRFISYVDVGDGEPVVLLHGIPTWGYLWSGVLDRLSRSHRVLVPDLAGFGYSDRRDMFDRSIAAQAALLRDWLSVLGVSRAALVGHDIGGGVALRLALSAPDVATRLALLNTVCYDSWPIELMLQLGHPGAARYFAAGTVTTMLKQALKMGFASSPDGDFLDGLLAPYSTEVGKLSLIRNAAALNTSLTTELTPRLPDLCLPALVLWGVDDRFQPAEYGQRLAWDLPAARYVPISGARHFLMVDQPERTANELLALLDSSN